LRSLTKGKKKAEKRKRGRSSPASSPSRFFLVKRGEEKKAKGEGERPREPSRVFLGDVSRRGRRVERGEKREKRKE